MRRALAYRCVDEKAMILPRSALLFALAAMGVASCVGAPEPSRVLIPQMAAGSPPSSWRPYLEAIKTKIYGFWTYPCLGNRSTGGCDRKAGEVTVEAEVNDDGQLEALRVLQSSGIPIYDDTAVNAIQLAAPFDALPEDMRSAEHPMLKIRMRFRYMPDNPARPQ